ncbi:hypothetical protein [Metabacillus rhizolycopersici]|uniref:CopG family transcriptional regulator n=1 Tax=Metabacillus rhizolycopersici TaxID=2875709 RepID=A0ABS7UYP9_9BACI|nr:hypothetical protein [Metabacillus rhizolycopersici]MBZ5753457.1 hypothetical protein [Metabacillus rhizolycopersici]
MSVDQKALIRSILEALAQEGVKIGDLAKQIPGISEKPFRNALKEAGYEFRNSGQKGWFFIGEGEEPLDKSIFDYVKSSSPKVHTPFTQSNKKFTESNKEFIHHSPTVHEQFTQDEIHMIKEMLKSWKEVASTTQSNELSLYDRVKQLPQSDKTRKTIVIDRIIGKRLDKFCETERINKSDVFHLALTDFLEKYEK